MLDVGVILFSRHFASTLGASVLGTYIKRTLSIAVPMAVPFYEFVESLLDVPFWFEAG